MGQNSIIWALLEPIIGISLLSAIFMVAVPAPPLGEDFALFYATGLLPILIFQDITQKMNVAIRFSRPLLGFADIGLAEMALSRAALAVLVQLVVMALILTGLTLVSRFPVGFDVSQLFSAIAAILVLSLGVGVLGCWLSIELPVWSRVWAAILRPLILVSGVFFLVDEIPDPFRDWAMWNPLAHIISAFRAGVYPPYEGALASLLYVSGFGVMAMAVGLYGLRVRKSQLIEGLI